MIGCGVYLLNLYCPDCHVISEVLMELDTRLTVEMCPASGRLAVMGWEPDHLGLVEPVTARTEVTGEKLA